MKLVVVCRGVVGTEVGRRLGVNEPEYQLDPAPLIALDCVYGSLWPWSQQLSFWPRGLRSELPGAPGASRTPSPG